MGHENVFHFELSVFFLNPLADISSCFIHLYSYSHLILINLSKDVCNFGLLTFALKDTEEKHFCIIFFILV